MGHDRLTLRLLRAAPDDLTRSMYTTHSCRGYLVGRTKVTITCLWPITARTCDGKDIIRAHLCQFRNV